MYRSTVKLLAAALGLAMAIPTHADEGMWLPSQLPERGVLLSEISYTNIGSGLVRKFGHYRIVLRSFFRIGT